MSAYSTRSARNALEHHLRPPHQGEVRQLSRGKGFHAGEPGSCMFGVLEGQSPCSAECDAHEESEAGDVFGPGRVNSVTAVVTVYARPNRVAGIW